MDGGLYAEMIQNRAFQGTAAVPPSLTAYTPINGAILSVQNDSEPLSEAIPNYMSVSGGSGRVGFANSGWWGIDVQVQSYKGSFYVKGSYNGTFTASLGSATSDETFSSVDIQSSSTADRWTRHEFELVPDRAASDTNNTFSITFASVSRPVKVCQGSFSDWVGQEDTTGPLNFTLMSLFPPTYNDRPNGLRPDLMEALARFNPVSALSVCR